MKWFDNPKNIWGVWVNSARWQKLLLTASVAGLFCMMPFVNYLQASQQLKSVVQDIQQLEEQIVHQQQLVASLQQQSEQNLTAEFARQLPTINQKIQVLAKHLNIEHSEWSFSTYPIITLQIQGHFNKLCEFLTALLKTTNLYVIQWNITQLTADERNDTQSIHSQLILQLGKD